jgi:anti-sigma factor RsiW
MAVLACFRLRRRIGAYLDEALDARGHRSVAAHLASCARCQRQAEDLRRLRAALRRAVSDAPPPDWTGFWAGLVRGIEHGRQTSAPSRRRWRPRLAFGGALAAAVLISVTLWQGFFSSTPPEAAVVVRSARTEAPGGSVMVYSPPERDIAVVWVFGLE